MKPPLLPLSIKSAIDDQTVISDLNIEPHSREQPSASPGVVPKEVGATDKILGDKIFFEDQDVDLVAGLDQVPTDISTLYNKDPKRSLVEHLKERHGVNRSSSDESCVDNVTSVVPRSATLSRAGLLSSAITQQKPSRGLGRRASRKTSNVERTKVSSFEQTSSSDLELVKPLTRYEKTPNIGTNKF